MGYSLDLAAMRIFPISRYITAVCLGILVFTASIVQAADDDTAKPKDAVTYEAFGAVGDGKTDDLPAICKAHAYANEHSLPVKSNPQATYHLGHQALTAIIQTDTDWATSKFIIDDSKDVEKSTLPLFDVCSPMKAIPLKIQQLKRGQDHLDLRPASDCLVYVENKNRKLFIRRGSNQNNGRSQSEVFILRQNGSIEGGIDWDYDVVTSVNAQPIDAKPLVIRGGIFTSIANMDHGEKDSGYWERNILIRRSNTEVDGLTHHVTGETDVGQPYGGFLCVQKCANITLRHCKIDGHKTYSKIGNAGKPVAMGSYGYLASYVMNLLMIKCTMDDIQDRSRWGVVASNFIKNFLVEDCVLSRVDVHQGISGKYIIRRSTLGHAGLNATGRGQLIVENSTLYGRHFIRFREDYGSTWDGDVLIKNCRWILKNPIDKSPLIFGTDNDGQHDFGYPCSMPRHIRIDGLDIEDSNPPKGYKGVTFFNDALPASRVGRLSPYRLTETLDVRALKTVSGIPPRISDNPDMAKAIKVTGL
jgi:hypothetical protein